MVTMHGLFDLKMGRSDVQFKQDFDNFCTHLKQQDLLVTWRYMVRVPDQVYDARPPLVQFYVAMDFADLEQSEKCKKYVMVDTDPVNVLHRAVNSKVENTQFFLSEDVE